MRGGREWSDDNNDSGGDDVRQVQVEDEECSHGNLLSTGRMLSLPSDNYPQALKCSPYPPIGQEAYVGYSYSGSLLVNSQLKEGRDFPALEPLTGCCSVALLEITTEVAETACDWDHLCYYEEIILILRTNRKGWFTPVNHPRVYYDYSLLLLPECICFSTQGHLQKTHFKCSMYHVRTAKHTDLSSIYMHRNNIKLFYIAK